MKDSSNCLNGGPGQAHAITSYSLLQGVREGDARSWQRLEHLYRPLMKWWCRQREVCEQDVADVVQEVFQTVHRKIASFRRERAGSFRCWLRRITANKARDHHRRKQGQAQATGGSEARAALEQVPAEPAEDSGAMENASERALLVRRALTLLRDEFERKTWEACQGTVVEGRDPKDVAAELGMSANAVRIAKSRVLARLRQVLEDLGEWD